ncbi:MAG: type I 3-dehydroquinate dehydratase [Bacteroidales bacterium]|nr:type I 3-dehydroquinate dehydratase [Bacteroidales bacterium]
MICTSLQNKTFEQILAILEDPAVEMAEIRLDRCPLTDDQIEELFSESDTPLIATCRIAESASPEEAERRLHLAIEAGARFADLEIEAPAPLSKRFQQLCHKTGTEIIRSFHDFTGTPDIEVLQRVLARCFRYGADIAKIVTTCRDGDEAARIESLYTIVLEEVDSLQGRLVAFGMGEAGRGTRLECLRRGAPFSYAALNDAEATAPGQWSVAEMHDAVYGGRRPYRAEGRTMPASKSFAQRAILAAALAEGTSHLDGYSPCGDSEAALRVAEALGATVRKDGALLTITGTGARPGSLDLERLDVGESGLLTRLSIPVLAAVGSGRFVVDGHGTLPGRPLAGAADIMASFGVLLSNASEREGRDVYVPASVKGHLIPGMADVPGQGGSQLISGLLMALPLCDKDSVLHVSDPKSIPYMYITLDVLRHFGIQTRSEMEGDAELLEADDWSACSGITFRVRGRQHYRAADFAIEGDWSAAANLLVAGAVFGSAELRGMDTKSLQADLTIIDILVEAGAVVSQLEEGTVCVRKAPLEAFRQDLNHAPDLFPIVSVLAAFCAGESRLGGVGRLAGKESNRAEAILQMLTQMGVEARIEGDDLVIFGESLSARLLGGRLLKGGAYTSRHDHRMVMALKVASLGTESPIVIDDEACVGKSFPEFKL